MKVGFVIIGHQSEMRPQGFQFIDEYIRSLCQYALFPYKVYLIDNSSDEPYNYMTWLDMVNIEFTYIEDQFELGITGAWNLGIHQAYEDGCDLIVGMADDMYFNETINYFVNAIYKHQFKDDCLYGPVSNGIWSKTKQFQERPIPEIFELSGKGKDIPNGFFFAFTPKFYEKFRHSERELFALKHKYDGGDGKWGGQEGEFWRMAEDGARFFIVGPCWLHHHKLQGYKDVRNLERSKG
jgi:hypothetical protein